MELKSTYFTIALLIGIACMNYQPLAGQNTDETIKAKIAAMAESKKLYEEYCGGCHGVLMQSFVDREWVYGDSPKALYVSIAKGRGANEAMPGFEEAFSEKQINELVEYIQYGIENVEQFDFDDQTITGQTFEAEQFTYQLETFADGLDSPWGMAFLPDGDLLVTEKQGQLLRFNKNGDRLEISGVPPVNSEGQGGLMDIELHPDYEKNGWIYLTYSIFKKEGFKVLTSTAVARYKLEGNRLVNEELIFEALPYARTRHHYGSRMEFDKDGYLFVTVGDRGARDVNPQDLTKFPGKVHRIHDDGTIPEDNPFINVDKAVKSIYSYGHRNPQGLAIHPSTGVIWEHEHGPKGGDELNAVEPGINYGWPVISYGINYNGTIFTEIVEKDGLEQPITYWVPSIAPCGMKIIAGDKYPGWEGAILVGSLRFQYVNLCQMEGQKVVKQEQLMKKVGRVRCIRQSEDGYIYVSTEEPGKIYKVVPTIR